MQLVALHYKRTKGYTIIEVMVAVFILSFSLLGIASMQLTSLENTNSAALRTQSIAISADLIERIKNNPELLIHIRDNNLDSKTDFTQSSSASCNTIAGCSPTVLIKAELEEWKMSLKRLGDISLASGTTSEPPVHVTMTHKNNQIFELEVKWLTKQWKKGGTAQKYTRTQQATSHKFTVALN